MLTQERRKTIRGSIEVKGAVKVSDLAAEFNVSRMTIRRDLSALSDSGFIERTHGGAVAVNDGFGSMEQAINQRINHLTQEKRNIASAAAKLVNTGETKFISAGSIDQLELNAEDGIKTLSESGSVLVLVDLFGASPFNVSLRLLQRFPEIKIVTGASLPMLIEALMNRESMDLVELADHVAQTGRDHSKTLDEWMSSAN